jgi:hypothetical protein
MQVVVVAVLLHLVQQVVQVVQVVAVQVVVTHLRKPVSVELIQAAEAVAHKRVGQFQQVDQVL